MIGSRFRTPHAVENLEAGRDDRPIQTAFSKNRECRMEGRGIVERAGVDRVRVGLADLAAEHETRALGAAVADRVAAIRRFLANSVKRTESALKPISGMSRAEPRRQSTQ
jgi:2-keto-3-deoxy-L-rhamnonate aldolase RhmA